MMETAPATNKGISLRVSPVNLARRRSTSPSPFIVLPPRRIVNGSGVGRPKRTPPVSCGPETAGRAHPSDLGADKIRPRHQLTKPNNYRSDPQAARVRRRQRRRPPPTSLFWVRRDKFFSGDFSADDCFPVGATDYLVEPKQFSFSVDFWTRRESRPMFATVVRGMAGAGAPQGSRGGRYAGGRSRNEGIRPTVQQLAADPPPTIPHGPMSARPSMAPNQPQHQSPHVSIFAKPPIVPMATAPSMMYPAMGQMYPDFAAAGYQQYPANPWPQNSQQPHFQFPYPYPQNFPQPAVVGGSASGGSGQTGSSKNKKKQKQAAGKQALKANSVSAESSKDPNSAAADIFNVDPKYIGAIATIVASLATLWGCVKPPKSVSFAPPLAITWMFILNGTSHTLLPNSGGVLGMG